MPEEKEVNVFGQPVKDGAIVAPVAEVVKEEEKKPEVNPLEVELRGQIEALKKEKSEYGDNLSRQGKLIKKLEADMNALKDRKPEEKIKPVFENIKTSKDLTKEERAEMSDREIVLMDSLAETQKQMNALAEKTSGEFEVVTTDAFDVNKAVQDTAMKLAEGNYMKAQQLVEKFNSLGLDLTKITEDNVAEKLQAVIALVPDFVPKKEQENVQGGAVKAGGGADQYGIAGVVAAAQADRDAASAGNYAL